RRGGSSDDAVDPRLAGTGRGLRFEAEGDAPVAERRGDDPRLIGLEDERADLPAGDPPCQGVGVPREEVLPRLPEPPVPPLPDRAEDPVLPDPVPEVVEDRAELGERDRGIAAGGEAEEGGEPLRGEAGGAGGPDLGGEALELGAREETEPVDRLP